MNTEDAAPEPELLSTQHKIRKFVEENKTSIIAGTGFVAGIATTLWCVERPSRYPWGSIYNPNQPIPGLLMDEERIKRNIAVGFLVVEYFKSKGLTEEFIEFADQRAIEIFEAVSKRGLIS